MPLRVLLVDDDGRFRALARRTLMADGVEVVAEVEHGAAVVSAVVGCLPGADRGRRRPRAPARGAQPSDGAQQRLVGLALMLRLAGRRAAGDAALTDLLADAARELDDALGELRELARGIHPAIVDDAGLGGALETLAERPGVPVDLDLDLPCRLPEPVEVGAYYLVAEALANVNKHANARQATVRATVAHGALRVTVSDDGRGGAGATPGSGLEGLADRVSALGGELAIDSSPQGGTVVSADIPLAAPPDVDVERRRVTTIKWIGWENWEAPGELYEQITYESWFCPCWHGPDGGTLALVLAGVVVNLTVLVGLGAHGHADVASLWENFDNVTAPALPPGWTSTVVTGRSSDKPWKTGTSAVTTYPIAASPDRDPLHRTERRRRRQRCIHLDRQPRDLRHDGPDGDHQPGRVTG